MVSPWTPRGTVGHGLYDHTSVLRMIEWRWDLPPLTVRDATAQNLADLLDFSHPQLEAPTVAVPRLTLHQVCPDLPLVQSPWDGLRHLARSAGFLTD
jgi:phospholipase C